jgi:uncharacterized protein
MQFEKIKATLAVFAKPPIAGQVKTRLTPGITSAQAAGLAAAFLLDTWNKIRDISGVFPILATTDAFPENAPVPEGAKMWMQGEGDLGDRMERILRKGLQLAPAAIAIGTDIAHLPRACVEEALAKLEEFDAVLGPVEDGGYYLIGLRRCPHRLLAGLPWSVPETMERTIARLKDNRFSVALLPASFDIDTPVDLDRLSVLLSAEPARAPATARYLRDELGPRAVGRRPPEA